MLQHWYVCFITPMGVKKWGANLRPPPRIFQREARHSALSFMNQYNPRTKADIIVMIITANPTIIESLIYFSGVGAARAAVAVAQENNTSDTH